MSEVGGEVRTIEADFKGTGVLQIGGDSATEKVDHEDRHPLAFHSASVELRVRHAQRGKNAVAKKQDGNDGVRGRLHCD